MTPKLVKECYLYKYELREYTDRKISLTDNNFTLLSKQINDQQPHKACKLWTQFYCATFGLIDGMEAIMCQHLLVATV